MWGEMEMRVKRDEVIQIALMSAVLIATIRTITLLFNGQVPSVSSIRLIGNFAIALPFSVSRWGDVFIGPIAVTILYRLATGPSFKLANAKERDSIGPGLAMVLGLFLGSVAGIFSIHEPDLVFHAMWCLSIVTVIQILFGPLTRNLASWTACLVFCTNMGLVMGLPASLAIALVVVPFTLLVMAFRSFWDGLWDRFTGEDKEQA